MSQLAPAVNADASNEDELGSLGVLIPQLGEAELAKDPSVEGCGMPCVTAMMRSQVNTVFPAKPGPSTRPRGLSNLEQCRFLNTCRGRNDATTKESAIT